MIWWPLASSRLPEGLTVPIPTLPAEVMVIRIAFPAPRLSRFDESAKRNIELAIEPVLSWK